MLVFDCFDVGNWLCGRWIFGVWTLDFGYVDVVLRLGDVGFQLAGCIILFGR